MVTSSVGMLNWIHSNTTNLWPAVSLNFVFVVSTTSFQDWFVDTSTSSNKSDHGSVGRGDDFLGSRRELDPGPVGVGVVGDHGGVVAAGPRQRPAVPGLLLQVADDGSSGMWPMGITLPMVIWAFL